MPDTISAAAPVFTLPAVLDLTQAAALKQELQAALAAAEGLTLDAAGVARVTSPCLQVLCAGIRAFAETGGPPLRIRNASDAFTSAVAALALEPLLQEEG
ncbi:MAG: STAS domain-containing protein [Proteobacteria bacterium]|nr:STAS domain-containing protein [Pseudomonadota bacterium]